MPVLPALYPIAVILLSLLHLLAPQRNGLPALTQVFAPYLFLPLALLLPFALRRRAWVLRAALVICLLLFAARFMPRLGTAAPETTGGPQLTALSWNVRLAGRQAEMRPLLLAGPADIVALLEADGTWIERDDELARLYPYRLVRRGEPTAGMVLLSRHPILEHIPAERLDAANQDLRLVWARVELGAGETLMVVAAHPLPARLFDEDGHLQGYDATQRDGAIREIRSLVDPPLRRGERLLLLGDFNLTEREPAYGELSAGLLDSHRIAGAGPGLTWRPDPLMRWELPLLRIDYIFSSPNLAPLGTSVDCAPRGSDHCAILARFELR